jgi:hypothetical protein
MVVGQGAVRHGRSSVGVVIRKAATEGILICIVSCDRAIAECQQTARVADFGTIGLASTISVRDRQAGDVDYCVGIIDVEDAEAVSARNGELIRSRTDEVEIGTNIRERTSQRDCSLESRRCDDIPGGIAVCEPDCVAKRARIAPCAGGSAVRAVICCRNDQVEALYGSQVARAGGWTCESALVRGQGTVQTSPMIPVSLADGSIIGVGPPLYCKGPRAGVPALIRLPAVVLHIAQSPPVLPETMLLVIDGLIVPRSIPIPPVPLVPALLPSIVLLLIVSSFPSAAAIAPPAPGALLPKNVLLFTVVVPPATTMAPPWAVLIPVTLLFTNVLLFTVRVGSGPVDRHTLADRQRAVQRNRSGQGNHFVVAGEAGEIDGIAARACVHQVHRKPQRARIGGIIRQSRHAKDCRGRNLRQQQN